MEGFKNDLIALFKKYGLIVLKDSVVIEYSQLYITRKGNTRCVIFKFEQSLTTEEAKEHSDKYGAIVNSFFD